jgi:hypothetical protein
MLFVMSEGEGPVDDALNMYYHIAHHLNDGLKERWGDAQQCVGADPFLQRPAANQENCHSPFALRPSPFALRHSKEKPSCESRRAPQVRF